MFSLFFDVVASVVNLSGVYIFLLRMDRIKGGMTLEIICFR